MVTATATGHIGFEPLGDVEGTLNVLTCLCQGRSLPMSSATLAPMKAGDRLVAWLAVALSVAGCGVESGGTASERAAPLHPRSRLRATAGERVVRCWFPDSPGSRRGRLVTFVVP